MQPEQPTNNPAAVPPELEGPFEHHRLGLLRGIGGTILATAGLYAAMGAPRGVNLDVPLGQHTTELSAPAQELPGGEASAAVEASLNEVSKKEVVTVALEQYALLFSADKRAGEITGPQELTKVRDAITGLKAEGYSITGMDFTGRASDEDDTTDANGRRTAGLGVSSPDSHNPKLAEKRAVLLEPLVINDLQQHDMDVPPITISGGVEDFLTEDEISHVDSLMKQFGYHDRDTMVMQYNLSRKTPPEVTAYLDEILASERNVTVTIDAVKAQVAETTGSATAVAPGEQTPPISQKESHKRKLHLHLPLGTFLPVLLKNRRRVEESDEPEPNPKDTGNVDRPTYTIRGGELVSTNGKPGLTGGIELPVETGAVPGNLPKDFEKQNGHIPGRRFVEQTAVKHKQPRPQNFHGTRGVNSSLGRDRGGGRRGSRG